MAPTGKVQKYNINFILTVLSILIFFKKWARQVLTIELNVSLKQRLKQKKQYEKETENGEKILVVRWIKDVNLKLQIFSI